MTYFGKARGRNSQSHIGNYGIGLNDTKYKCRAQIIFVSSMSLFLQRAKENNLPNETKPGTKFGDRMNFKPRLVGCLVSLSATRLSRGQVELRSGPIYVTHAASVLSMFSLRGMTDHFLSWTFRKSRTANSEIEERAQETEQNTLS